jgi:hypothetical protein
MSEGSRAQPYRFHAAQHEDAGLNADWSSGNGFRAQLRADRAEPSYCFSLLL